MGAPRHDRSRVRFGLSLQGVNEMPQFSPDQHRVVFKVEPDKGCDLVVAAAAGTYLAAQFGAQDWEKGCLERSVHVFVGVGGAQFSCRNPPIKLVKPGNHRGKLGTGEVSRGSQSPRVGPGTS